MKTGKLPYEEAAERKNNLSGWVCKTCRQYWANDERAARWCCASDTECGEEGCKERTDKSYTRCTTCRGKQDVARWEALKEVEWDEETPLVLDDDDTYFFHPEDLERYLEDHELKIEDLRLVLCVPEHKPNFDMTDLMADYLPEDQDCDDPTEINKVVNDWIEEHAPEMWVPGKTRPTLGSVRPS